MTLLVKEVPECRNGAWGNFLLRSRYRAEITISRAKNLLLADYGATLLHELLHFWVTMLRRKGVRVDNRREHRFIYAAEAVIVKLARKHMPKRKP
jgi:hypothetical protein